MSSVVSSSRVRPALKWSVAEVAGDGHQPGAEVLALPAEAAHAAQRPEEGLGGEVLGEGRRAGCGSRRTGRPTPGSGRRAARTPRLSPPRASSTRAISRLRSASDSSEEAAWSASSKPSAVTGRRRRDAAVGRAASLSSIQAGDAGRLGQRAGRERRGQRAPQRAGRRARAPRRGRAHVMAVSSSRAPGGSAPRSW